MTSTSNSYTFRTLNYLGSKLRLLDFIEQSISNMTPSGAGVCDLFAGSGCVSYRLSHLYPLISCDIQQYSKVLCDALITENSFTMEDYQQLAQQFENQHAKSLLSSFDELIQIEEKAIREKDLELLACILEHGSVEVALREANDAIISPMLCHVVEKLTRNHLYNELSLISRYYGGVYFSYRQAVEIDVILEVINRQSDTNKRQLLLAALLSTASDIVDTVGKHFAQPIKARNVKGVVKTTVYNKAVKDKTIHVIPLYLEWVDRYMKLPRSGQKHLSLQADFMDCLRQLPDWVKTVYADPPYTRDHYSRFYHVLETMTLRDLPEISTVTVHGKTHISNGIYRKDRHQSPFCIKSKALGSFRQMFEFISTTDRNLLLSYSPYDATKKAHPRVVTMEQLTTLAKSYFNQVEVISAGHFAHNKLNSTPHLLEASDEAEVLIVCTNNNA